MLREDLSFDPTGCAHQHNFVSLIGCHSRQGKSRHQVTTRASACYYDFHAARLARPTLASTPVAASATMSEERPYDMNGSVTPVAGITARLTPI